MSRKQKSILNLKLTATLINIKVIYNLRLILFKIIQLNKFTCHSRIKAGVISHIMT